MHTNWLPRLGTLVGLMLALQSAGCMTCRLCPPPPDSLVPRELKKVNLPRYTIEPPDILLIDALSVVPKPPYHIAPLDQLLIQASEALPTEPISGIFPVDPEGRVNLGPTYGSVSVVGLTLPEAKTAVETQLRSFIKEPKVTLSLAQSRAMQQIRGEHLVTPDGTISLGTYGSVPVTGLTLEQAKEAIEAHLSAFLQKPEISVSVAGYNSRVYYLIFDGAGYGQQVYRLPVTGNETVLDAVASLNGLPASASLHKIWVARPAPDEMGCDQILPVDWMAITDRGETATNYQILPGDRVHVSADCLIHTDNFLAKLFAPVERVFGVTLLGTQTVSSIVFFRQQGNRGNSGSGF